MDDEFKRALNEARESLKILGTGKLFKLSHEDTPFDVAARGCLSAMDRAVSGCLRPMPLVHEGARSYPQTRPIVEDVEDCAVTFEDTRSKLESIEHRLAQQFGITHNVRKTLLEMELKGALDECDLVADWQQTFASYLDWLRQGYV